MHLKLSKYTFVRNTPHYTHIANIKNGHQATFNGEGKGWLNPLSYEWRSLEDITCDAIEICSISLEDVVSFTEDYAHFINTLVHDGYLLESPLPFDKEDSFERTSNNPKYLHTKPETLVVEITDGCNERCIHCYIPNQVKCQSKSISYDDFQRMVYDFKNISGKNVRLTGGEVMMHPDWKEMVEYCRGLGLSVEIMSNLQKAAKEDLNFIGKNTTHIQVSLYSMNPVLHDSITLVRGSHAKTLAAINYLLSIGAPVSIAAPMLKNNIIDFVELIKFADQQNIHISIEPIITAQQDGSKTNLTQRLSLSEVEHVLESIAQYSIQRYQDLFMRQDINDDIPEFDFLTFLYQSVCDIGRRNICVSSSGNYNPCTGWHSKVLGNIRTQCVEDVWQGEVLEKMRKVSEYSFNLCVSCPAICYCVRCMKRNDYETGNMYSISETFCATALLMKNVYDRNQKR